MQLVREPKNAVDLTATPIHLGRDSRAMPVVGFAWDPAVLEAYGRAVAGDGAEGRMVMIFDGPEAGEMWEQHPLGDEVVVCLSGHVTVIHDIDGGDERRVVLGPSEATVNPRGVWHAVNADASTQFLTITPGVGTEHRPR